MKAYLFVETGETRKAHGEWRLDDGDCIKSIHTDAEYPILTRHEIEINPSADVLYLSQGIRGWGKSIEWKEICLPRTRKTVKRWKWAMATKKGKDVGITTHLTEEELHKYYPNQMWYQRLDNTMIEVEE